jgi:hypothetical protein
MITNFRTLTDEEVLSHIGTLSFDDGSLLHTLRERLSNKGTGADTLINLVQDVHSDLATIHRELTKVLEPLVGEKQTEVLLEGLQEAINDLDEHC